MIIKKLNDLNNVTNSIEFNYKDIFYEKQCKKNYVYINNKLEDIINEYINGVSITLQYNDTDYFLSSNNFEDITKEFLELKKEFKNKETTNIEIEYKEYLTSKNHNSITEEEKLEILTFINDYCRKYDNRINQVKIDFSENVRDKYIVVNNKLVREKKISTRMFLMLSAKENDVVVTHSYNPGYNDDYSFLDRNNLVTSLDSVCKNVITKLSCKPFVGGLMPVVINSGFGAVLFHEACGHAMESYAIVDKTSILSDKLNKKIATDKVTIIDDATLDNLFGTCVLDDQGNLCKKNILIENGVLKNYLTDYKDGSKLGSESTASARRESYNYKAISRMNNTYLQRGNDSIEDMIKSIDYGIYAINLGGGSVNPNTGSFNFFVSFAYVIEKGELTRAIKDITLIGTIFDVLNNVEMVSNDLEFGPGMCGASSGSIPVTCGQPTIKVSKILVGGNIDE